MTREQRLDLLKQIEQDIYRLGSSLSNEAKSYALRQSIEELEQQPTLEKIRAEIEQIEINGHIRDVECFRAGINVALNVIDKYRKGSEEE